MLITFWRNLPISRSYFDQILITCADTFISLNYIQIENAGIIRSLDEMCWHLTITRPYFDYMCWRMTITRSYFDYMCWHKTITRSYFDNINTRYYLISMGWNLTVVLNKQAIAWKGQPGRHDDFFLLSDQLPAIHLPPGCILVHGLATSHSVYQSEEEIWLRHKLFILPTYLIMSSC